MELVDKSVTEDKPQQYSRPGLNLLENNDMITDNTDTGNWEYNANTKDIKWSAGFYALLGYEPNEIESSYHYFTEQLVYHEDKKALVNVENAPQQVRLLTKNSGYQWFEIQLKKDTTEPGHIRQGSITNIHQYKMAAIKARQNELFFAETAKIAKVGGWEIDVKAMAPALLKETYDIYEVKSDVPLSLDEFISFFEPSHRAVLTNAIDDAVRYCRPFEVELLFRSAKNNVGWLRCKGVPFINDAGQCTRISGIFQKIDNHKKQETDLRNSMRLLEDHNKRLQNFAYIVSHNLRSHAGNLKFMVSLHDETKKAEQEEIFAHIRSISNNLTETVEHLDEIVKIQVETIKEKKTVNIETVFKNTIKLLESNIRDTNALIEHDFQECPTVEYIPAYLESIFQNLLTNALKYRDPERRPLISCRTYKDQGHCFLSFQDNGLGIDMKQHGDKIFGMYKTFHQNKDAKGIGLFITRSQIESLGGSIKIDSAVNIGTKFTIRLV